MRNLTAHLLLVLSYILMALLVSVNGQVNPRLNFKRNKEQSWIFGGFLVGLWTLLFVTFWAIYWNKHRVCCCCSESHSFKVQTR